jgi:TatD DNase family protein
MWIDTHCHLDADEFDDDRAAVVMRARAVGVSMMVLPVGHIDDGAKAAAIAREHGFAYALGIHPLWIDRAREVDRDVERLQDEVRTALADPRFIGIGEIGIDQHEPRADLDRQQWFYREQLKVARDHDLPIIVHVRRSADLLLKHLRAIPVAGGIVHAFNGSKQQAQQLIERGFKLGFGGSLTYAGSQRIRAHAAQTPADAWVLETDAPYIPPQWLRKQTDAGRNEPAELAAIAQQMAALRGVEEAELAATNRTNAIAALPRLGRWLERAD